MRGKVCNRRIGGGYRGITPAHAGKSGRKQGSGDELQDHPRACGEKVIAQAEWKAMAGSPPRMRGKVYKITPPCVPRRITPAHAGKSTGGTDA